MIPADAGVDVFSDNTSHLAVFPPTTPPHQHEGRTQPGTQGHRQARRIVRDYIDTLDHYLDDRVMQETNSYPIYQRGQQNTDFGRDDGSCVRKTSVASTTVLIIAGISTGAVSRGLNHAAALSSPNGITPTVFDSLAHLPNYSETPENQRLPRPVAALRDAAIEAHAAMVLTHYYGHIPATVHNALAAAYIDESHSNHLDRFHCGAQAVTIQRGYRRWHRARRVNGMTSSAVLMHNEGEGSQRKWTSTGSPVR